MKFLIIQFLNPPPPQFFPSSGQILSLPPLLKQSHDTSLRMEDQFTTGIENNT